MRAHPAAIWPVGDMAQSSDLTASQIDRLVGDRIRRRRILIGLTQDQLGEALGISYQQVQKYETGANRVSAGRLYQIAETLQTSVAWFFDELCEVEDGADETAPTRHVIELVRGFARLPEDRHRQAVLALVRTLADAPGAKSDGETPSALQRAAARDTARSNGKANGHTNGDARPGSEA